MSSPSRPRQSGLGVVSGLDPHSRILSDNFDGIVARYASMPVDPNQARRRQQAAVVPNNWDEVETRLAGGTRSANTFTATVPSSDTNLF